MIAHTTHRAVSDETVPRSVSMGLFRFADSKELRNLHRDSPRLGGPAGEISFVCLSQGALKNEWMCSLHSTTAIPYVSRQTGAAFTRVQPEAGSQ
jgi:hypothetical protein